VKKIIFVFIAILIASTQVFAWRISKDLEKEIETKKIALKEDDANSQFDLAITYAYSNKIEEGWELLKKADKIDPSFKEAGWKTYKEKTQNDPENWKIHFRYAFALYFNGKKEEAIKEFKKVIELDPKNIWAYSYIGLIYGEINKIDEAIQNIKKAIAIDYDVAAVHLLLSQAYYKKGDSWGGFKEASEAVRLRALGY